MGSCPTQLQEGRRISRYGYRRRNHCHDEAMRELDRTSVGIVEEILDPRDRVLQREVSVVIPAFEEAAHVASQIRNVRDVMEASGWRYEIIVVDDGSTDGTGEQAAQADAGAIVLRHRRNRGYGAALKSGIHAARYDWILITDADGTYP